MNHPFSPFGTTLVLLASVGIATIGTWVVSGASEALGRALPRLKATLNRHAANRALRASLKRASQHPRSAAEREAMARGAADARSAFQRALAANGQRIA